MDSAKQSGWRVARSRREQLSVGNAGTRFQFFARWSARHAHGYARRTNGGGRVEQREGGRARDALLETGGRTGFAAVGESDCARTRAATVQDDAAIGRVHRAVVAAARKPDASGDENFPGVAPDSE